MPLFRLHFAPLLQVAATLSLCLCSQGCASPLGTILKQNGFSELRPPSTYVPPGTVVYIRDRKPLHVGIVCDQASSLGEPRLLRSSSMESRLNRVTTIRFDMSPRFIHRLLSGLRSQFVRSITFDLVNVQVLEISDSEVFRSVLNRSRDCWSAMHYRQIDGEALSLVKAAFRADVTFYVDFDREAGLNPGSREKLLGELAAGLGADAVDKSTNRMFGRNLIWGIVDDTSLATVTPPTDKQQDATADRATRLIPANATINIVLPQGPDKMPDP